MAAGTFTGLILLKPDYTLGGFPWHTPIKMFHSMDELFHCLSSETLSIQYSTNGLHYPSYSLDITSFFPLLLAWDCWNDHKGTWRPLCRVLPCFHTGCLLIEQAQGALEASLVQVVRLQNRHGWGSYSSLSMVYRLLDQQTRLESSLKAVCKTTVDWQLSGICITSLL